MMLRFSDRVNDGNGAMVVEWTEPMIETLQSLRAKGHPLLICAERIGVSYPLAVYQARAMGLAQRMNRGRIPGTEQIASRSAAAAD